jgi:hypothetical protein
MVLGLNPKLQATCKAAHASVAALRRAEAATASGTASCAKKVRPPNARHKRRSKKLEVELLLEQTHGKKIILILLQQTNQMKKKLHLKGPSSSESSGEEEEEYVTAPEVVTHATSAQK